MRRLPWQPKPQYAKRRKNFLKKIKGKNIKIDYGLLSSPGGPVPAAGAPAPAEPKTGYALLSGASVVPPAPVGTPAGEEEKGEQMKNEKNAEDGDVKMLDGEGNEGADGDADAAPQANPEDGAGNPQEDGAAPLPQLVEDVDMEKDHAGDALEQNDGGEKQGEENVVEEEEEEEEEEDKPEEPEVEIVPTTLTSAQFVLNVANCYIIACWPGRTNTTVDLPTSATPADQVANFQQDEIVKVIGLPETTVAPPGDSDFSPNQKVTRVRVQRLEELVPHPQGNVLGVTQFYITLSLPTTTNPLPCWDVLDPLYQVVSDTIVTETETLRDAQTGSMRKPLRRARKDERIICHSIPIIIHENVGTSVRIQITQQRELPPALGPWSAFTSGPGGPVAKPEDQVGPVAKSEDQQVYLLGSVNFDPLRHVVVVSRNF